MARQKVQKAVIGFLCLCTVLMFSMNFTCPEIDNTYGWLYSVLENLRPESVKLSYFFTGTA